MGCWYSTCFMSNLPLLPGDDITIFLLAPNYPDTKEGLTCYPNERYTPIGFPIFAEYDDDVRVRNIREINDYMRLYLHEFTTVYEKTASMSVDGEDVHVFKKYEWDELETFVQDVTCGHLFVDVDGKKLHLEHVMMHTGLYYDLIRNMSARIPHGQTKDFGTLMYEKIVKTFNWVKETDEASKLLKEKYGFEPPVFRRLSDRIHIEPFSRWRNLDKLAQYYLETEDAVIIDDILNYVIWNQVMNYSRKGYHCISGGGSQCQEMMLQKIIAEYTLAKCSAAELEADDEYEGNVLEETIYWWND